MQAETKFKQRVMRDLKALPGLWMVKTQQVAIRGTPDILACVRGRFVALELKRSEHAPADPLQLYTLELILVAGGFAAIAFPENWLTVLEQIRLLAGAHDAALTGR